MKQKVKTKESKRELYSDIEKRHEGFENQFNQDFIEGLPIIIRMDGNNFSSFTEGLEEPFDMRLTNLMIETCKYAVELTNARCGFVGSDEITLALYAEDAKTQLYYNRKMRKILSILSGKVSVHFNKLLKDYMPEKVEDYPSFDCRAWNVPTLKEGCNAFLLRENSIYKNAITMACMGNKVYSHKQIEGVNGKEKQEMLFKKGINFNDYPVEFKRGVYIQRRKFVKEGFDYSAEELANLPEKHHARTNPERVSEITEIKQLDMPIFSKVTNQEDVIFGGEEALTDSDSEQV